MKKNVLTMSLLNLLFALFILTNSNANAQIYQTWTNRYNGIDNLTDSTCSIATDNNGNIFAAGFTKRLLSKRDYLLVKYNSNGDTLWTRTYNGPNNGEDIIIAMALDVSGNVYVTGEVDSNYVTIGYSNDGVILWLNTYNGLGSGIDRPVAIATDASKNIFVTGYSDGSLTPDSNFNYATVKYNSAGVQQWAVVYNGPANKNDRASALTLDASGNVYVTGYAYSALGHRDYMTVKYNTNGVQQWVAAFDRNLGGYSKPYSIVTNSTYIWVTGRASNGVDYDFATVKYDMNGTQQWASIYDGGDKDYARFIGIDNYGNAYVTGSKFNLLSNHTDGVTVKYDAGGVEQWAIPYNGTANLDDDPRKLLVTGNGDVYICGETNTVLDSSDYFLIKYNTLGVQQWVKTYNGTGNMFDGIRAICRNSLGEIFVTGYSQNISGNKDVVTIKYSTTQPAMAEENSIDNSNIKIYPVPFESTATLYIPENIINSGSNIHFKLYDLLGKEIQSMENINSSNTVISRDKLPTGIYFYNVLVNDAIINNGKIVINK